jgi:tripartite-type tricarboxylate transporter receptor subunit TctC
MTTGLTRRGLAALGLTAAGGAAHGQGTGQATRLILPFPPGNQVDIVSRRLADPLRERLGTPIVVENRPGASGALALGQVARAPADGSVLLASSLSPLVITPAVKTDLPYDVLTDFAPIALLAYNDVVLVASPALGATSLADVARIARARGTPLPYGSIGIGTLGHLAVELIAARAGFAVQHIPYNGSAAAYTDMFRGDVFLMADGMAQAMAQVREGRLRAIGVLSAARSPFAQDVPTIAESGLPGLERIDVVGWSGMLAPKGVPAAVTARISDAVQTAMADPAMQQYLGTQSLRSYPRHTPDFMAGFMRTELATWRETGRLAGVAG